MIWDILLGLYLLGAAITFVYIWYKGIKACIRTSFGFKPQYKIWAPFNAGSKTITKDLSDPIKRAEPEYCDVVMNSLAYGMLFGVIYPVYLPIYLVRQPIKTYIKTLAYKIVATKEERVQRALGTDRPEKDDTSQRLQAILGSHKRFYGLQRPQVSDRKGPR